MFTAIWQRIAQDGNPRRKIRNLGISWGHKMYSSGQMVASGLMHEKAGVMNSLQHGAYKVTWSVTLTKSTGILSE